MPEYGLSMSHVFSGTGFLWSIFSRIRTGYWREKFKFLGKTAEAYSQPYQTSQSSFTIFTNSYFLDVWQGSEYLSKLVPSSIDKNWSLLLWIFNIVDSWLLQYRPLLIYALIWYVTRSVINCQCTWIWSRLVALNG